MMHRAIANRGRQQGTTALLKFRNHFAAVNRGAAAAEVIEIADMRPARNRSRLFLVHAQPLVPLNGTDVIRWGLSGQLRDERQGGCRVQSPRLNARDE